MVRFACLVFGHTCIQFEDPVWPATGSLSPRHWETTGLGIWRVTHPRTQTITWKQSWASVILRQGDSVTGIILFSEVVLLGVKWNSEPSKWVYVVWSFNNRLIYKILHVIRMCYVLPLLWPLFKRNMAMTCPLTLYLTCSPAFSPLGPLWIHLKFQVNIFTSHAVC